MREVDLKLIKAVKLGDKALIVNLLKQEANIGIIDQEGNSLLHLCVKELEPFVKIEDCQIIQNNLDIKLIETFDFIKDIIKKEKISIGNLLNKDCHSVLSYAIKNGVLNKYKQTIMGEYLIKLLQIGDCNGMTQFIHASLNKDYELLRELSELGANLNSCDDRGNTALMHACLNKDYEMIRELIRLGANLHMWNKQGYNILMISCLSGEFELAKELIKLGADLNSIDEYGNTLLMHACLRKNYKLVEFLINMGADLNIENNKTGFNALMIATSRRSYYYDDPDIDYEKLKTYEKIETYMDKNYYKHIEHSEEDGFGQEPFGGKVQNYKYWTEYIPHPYKGKKMNPQKFKSSRGKVEALLDDEDSKRTISALLFKKDENGEIIVKNPIIYVDEAMYMGSDFNSMKNSIHLGHSGLLLICKSGDEIMGGVFTDFMRSDTYRDGKVSIGEIDKYKIMRVIIHKNSMMIDDFNVMVTIPVSQNKRPNNKDTIKRNHEDTEIEKVILGSAMMRKLKKNYTKHILRSKLTSKEVKDVKYKFIKNNCAILVTNILKKAEIDTGYSEFGRPVNIPNYLELKGYKAIRIKDREVDKDKKMLNCCIQ